MPPLPALCRSPLQPMIHSKNKGVTLYKRIPCPSVGPNWTKIAKEYPDRTRYCNRYCSPSLKRNYNGLKYAEACKTASIYVSIAVSGYQPVKCRWCSLLVWLHARTKEWPSRSCSHIVRLQGGDIGQHGWFGWSRAVFSITCSSVRSTTKEEELTEGKHQL